ncbi:hypothetical protein [Clostridium saccharobutylicum]|uniref:Uncharacterized protein n=1 Tax=Clostridium saccharobutylicum DSM 13864 TaxID=1345695 RepID=U5MWL5_CLOSA|nr:hypothetical protein [Clostridium saccharobutylicum]AGX44903.1 hypothetical protein CLSA_c39430 [Clostridium saccharobutylicum DSM 13864]MBA2903687.1 hypothetical protein [Clostridium saccharobutylicum]MBA8788118.1 hypothetical protein [Clostridium saccharobutylicum]MBA8894795.1 hypothetical protein [Clostridium saccharobutylicum]MBA8984300.1 hypothetical protein [Clostridium saccharobutylicum]
MKKWIGQEKLKIFLLLTIINYDYEVIKDESKGINNISSSSRLNSAIGLVA